MSERGPGSAVRRGRRVRLRLTLSYAGFLMVAWVAFLLVLAFVLRYLPDDSLVVADDGGFAPNRSDLIEAALPVTLIGTAVLALVGLAGGWVVAGRMLRPLAELTQWLEHAFEEQGRFTGNASHELRTPHAVMKTMLEVARVDPDPDVEQLVTRLQEMNDRSIDSLESLLRLARADQVTPSLEPCDLADVVRRSLLALDPVIGERGIVVDTRLEAAPVLADPTLLWHLGDNLLGNAVRHNLERDGSLRVRTGTGGRGAWLEITNTGEPIDPAVVTTLVEPFVRGGGRVRSTTGPTGSGLGLSIVASIVRAHGADLKLAPRDGGGLVVTVAFPIA